MFLGFVARDYIGSRVWGLGVRGLGALGSWSFGVRGGGLSDLVKPRNVYTIPGQKRTEARELDAMHGGAWNELSIPPETSKPGGSQAVPDGPRIKQPRRPRRS